MALAGREVDSRSIDDLFLRQGRSSPELARSGSGAGVLVQGADQILDIARLQRHVGIQNKNVIGGFRSDDPVVAGTEAEVRAGKMRCMKEVRILCDDLQGSIGRGIVPEA